MLFLVLPTHLLSVYKEGQHQSESEIIDMFSARPFLYKASLIPMLSNSCNCKMGIFFSKSGRQKQPSFSSSVLLFSYFKNVKNYEIENMVVYHLPHIPGNSCWDVKGKRFCGASHWKIPGTNRNSEKVVLFSGWESSDGNSFTIYKFLEFRASFML